jgi:hypothetical protein
MCTLSWTRTSDRFTLWFNRDEQRSRETALPPEASTEILAPKDPRGGGSWIFVNHHGLTAALMNHYSAGTRPPANPLSRGQLLMSLSGCSSIPECETQLNHQLSTAVYAPCFLWVASFSEDPRMWCWEGESLTHVPLTPPPMRSTSSYRSAEVLEHRKQSFLHTVADPSAPTEAELESFHRHHDPEWPAYCANMERSDAWTVSHTRIRITPARATLSYFPRTGKPTEHSLAPAPTIH